MQLGSHRLVTVPARIGRGPARFDPVAVPAPPLRFSDDVKLFAATFAAGFLFVSLLLA